jgi:DNA polymerase-3 subunit alpha
MGLSAVYEDAVDAIIPVKKAEAYGQNDLFAGLGGEDEDTPAFGLDFAIPETEWPRKQLLATEREMLGLYVSAHPLDGTEHILARNRDTTLAELLAGGREGPVKVAGLITGVDRKITKQGNAWAAVQFADRDAAIEVCFFPATYQLVGHALIPDSVVSITGRAQDRDGTMNIIGSELVELDVSSAESGGKPPVQLAFREYKMLREPAVRELKRILGAHPGDSPVRVRLQGPDKTTVYELGFLVDPTSVASDIKGSFGADAWIGVA